MARISVLPQSVLSFHGGGVRGLLSLTLLSEIEKAHHLIKNNQIQLMAGTSTGSIIAAALGLGLDVDTILESYTTYIPKIFPSYKRWLRNTKFLHLGKPISAFTHYSNKKLRKCLGEVLLSKLPKKDDGKKRDDVNFGDCLHRTIIITVRLEDYKPIVFDSENPKYAEYSLLDIVTASCSAPFFFKPSKISDKEGCKFSYIDGGLAANSPSLSAINLLLREGVRADSINLMSFGTGLYPECNSSGRSLFKPLKTGKDAFKCAINSNAVISEDVCRTILTPSQYLPLNALIGTPYLLDDASRKTMSALERIAKMEFQKQETQDAIGQWVQVACEE